jgi:amidophosphoribosyltransferase
MCGIYARLSYYKSLCTFEKTKAQLDKLKHRGKDGMGVAVDTKEQMVVIKDVGDLSPKFNVLGDMSVGHVRYKTKGRVDKESCQPLIHENRIALVHNGHLEKTDYSPDSLLLLEYFKQYPQKSIFEIVTEIMKNTPEGSYSCIVMIHGVGLVAFRDYRGVRPLVYHQNEDRLIIASESCVLSENVIDVEPGQCVIFHKSGRVEKKVCTELTYYTPCLFEYIYFAHKNSVLNGISVYKARQILGRLLARRINDLDEQFDMIAPVPKTSCVSALEMSRITGIPYREVLTVRKGRSFILPRQTIRESLINEKFDLNEKLCKEKRVLLVDDSIVRGSTMRSLMKRFRAANVAHITIASCAPPIQSINVYGIDISSKTELVVNQGPDVAKLLGADRVIYQNLGDIVSAFLPLNPELHGFECSMFLK